MISLYYSIEQKVPHNQLFFSQMFFSFSIELVDQNWLSTYNGKNSFFGKKNKLQWKKTNPQKALFKNNFDKEKLWYMVTFIEFTSKKSLKLNKQVFNLKHNINL